MSGPGGPAPIYGRDAADVRAALAALERFGIRSVPPTHGGDALTAFVREVLDCRASYGDHPPPAIALDVLTTLAEGSSLSSPDLLALTSWVEDRPEHHHEVARALQRMAGGGLPGDRLAAAARGARVRASKGRDWAVIGRFAEIVVDTLPGRLLAGVEWDDLLVFLLDTDRREDLSLLLGVQVRDLRDYVAEYADDS